jgi:thymidylate synthase
MNIDRVRDIFLEDWMNGEFVIDKNGSMVLEIMNASFIAEDDFLIRRPNMEYVKREIEWYKSLSLFVDEIPGKTPAIWTQVADKNGMINSNYGYLIWHEDNFLQYEKVKDELEKNPLSRRAIMIYTRPEIWYQYNKDGMSDFICTNTVQYFNRNDKLHAVVQMRSQDSTFGYCNDWYWQKYVLDQLAIDLGLSVGDLHWNVGSLHVYERDFWCFEFYLKNLRWPECDEKPNL